VTAGGAAVALGTFDGVHRGHQAILKKAVALARRRGLTPAALTFTFPPRLFFAPSAAPSLLTTVDEKASLMRALGVSRVEALRFNARLARLSAAEFIHKILAEKLRARAVVAGYNFRFGRGREGDGNFLKREGRRRGIDVHIVKPVRAAGRPVSSGRVRDSLLAGDLAAARRLLRHPYVFSGRVVKGLGLGRKLGYPTANLAVPPEKIVPPGVYAVRARWIKGRAPGLCNIGFRPTLGEKKPRLSVEVHLLDFSGSLTGKELTVELVGKIRAERRFPSLAALTRQIRRDEAAGRRVLRRAAV